MQQPPSLTSSSERQHSIRCSLLPSRGLSGSVPFTRILIGCFQVSLFLCSCISPVFCLFKISPDVSLLSALRRWIGFAREDRDAMLSYGRPEGQRCLKIHTSSSKSMKTSPNDAKGPVARYGRAAEPALAQAPQQPKHNEMGSHSQISHLASEPSDHASNLSPDASFTMRKPLHSISPPPAKRRKVDADGASKLHHKHSFERSPQLERTPFAREPSVDEMSMMSALTPSDNLSVASKSRERRCAICKKGALPANAFHQCFSCRRSYHETCHKKPPMGNPQS